MQVDAGSGGQAIRVLVADNTRIHAQLLADALRRDRHLEVVGSTSQSQELIEAVSAQKIDVAVVGCNLDEQPLRGVSVLRELKAARPELKIVILLDSSKREVVLDAFRSGASGLFSRHESLEILSKCVHRVYEGQIWASTEQVGFAVEALASSPTVRAVGANGLSLLSKRELEVVRCLADGLTNREIAARLGLSQHTVKNYLFRVFDKLGVSNRLELLFLTLTQPGDASTAASIGDLPAFNGATEVPFSKLAQAAERGIPTAQVALAWVYWQGKGVAKDLISAYMWYLLSERISTEMKEDIVAAKRKLAETLTTEQIVEAQKRAAEKLKQGKSADSPMKVRNAQNARAGY
jgi:two-component system, NarL family, nitrate/nitrite response regulator NarL